MAKDCDRIYALSGGYEQTGSHSDLKALFEERLRRPMGSPMVTRFGMGAKAMGRIAELIKECIIDKKPVKEEVNRFRARYKKIKYSYDSIKEKKAGAVKAKN